ncbi:MAG: tRNA threonylcarbamoyladenosine dehydratase [Bacillota bacterium]
MSESPFARNLPLFGEAALKGLQKAHVLLVGLGGVGSHAALALARSGIGAFTLVDFDTVDATNINRQAIAFHSTIGKAKTELLKASILDINQEADVRIFTEYYKASKRDTVFDTAYDYIFDCVDNVPAKLDLILTAKRMGIPILSSAGLGNRLDPSKVTTGNLFDLEGDPLARKLKKALRKEGIHAVDAVYSSEAPLKRAGVATPASCAFVPPVGGIHGAASIVQKLIKNCH